MKPGILYVVSTPIGNLEDLTRRAERILGEVDIVLAEDTRRTGTLLSHHEIRTRTVSLHEHNEASRTPRVLEWLEEGLSLALVSDAGTPLVSDPGARLVREVAEAGHEVVPVPGASAVLAALVGSGISADRFTFYGFPPRKGTPRERFLEAVHRTPHTAVVYEAGNRVGALLADLLERAEEDGERRVAVGREMTKLHEEFIRGSLDELAAALGTDPLRGECVVVLEGAPEEEGGEERDELAGTVARMLLRAGVPPSGIARALRDELGIPRNEAYERVQRLADASNHEP